MTPGPLLLTLAFVLLGVLLLSLNLRSTWRWPIKAVAIVITGAFATVFFIGTQALLGWPTDRTLPDEFALHASMVREPSKRTSESGAIYLWLSPVGEESSEAAPPPRAHRLPYSRDLHERLARAEAQRADGRDIRGRRKPETPGTNENLQIELFEAPAVPLPEKPVG